jgi:hypothetical protein
MKKPKKAAMKRLGDGYIYFGKLDDQPSSGYYLVTLAAKDGSPRRLRVGRLGGWQRVRLWAELLPARP